VGQCTGELMNLTPIEFTHASYNSKRFSLFNLSNQYKKEILLFSLFPTEKFDYKEVKALV
jgi:hypothetical protein